MKTRFLALIGLTAAGLMSSSVVAQNNKAAQTLTIYTSSNEEFIRPIFETYTKETGVKINFVTDKGPVLFEKLKAEGAQSPADLFMTVDVGNLWLASQEKLFTPLKSPIIEKNIPSQYRAPQNEWVGLSVRARPIFYNPQKITEGELKEIKTYADLAKSTWSKRLCLRTSNNVYNQSLVASFIENSGVEETEKVLKGWVKNLAAPVFSGDTQVLEAIDAGQCDLGIANTYYFARLLQKKPDANIKVLWPEQDERGTHVNVMGGGVLASSKNKAEALKFLEWASGAQAQQLFASKSFEYPANVSAKIDPLVEGFGNFKPDSMPLFKAGEKQQAAVQLMDRVGYK